jgi:hypothetical protein
MRKGLLKSVAVELWWFLFAQYFFVVLFPVIVGCEDHVTFFADNLPTPQTSSAWPFARAVFGKSNVCCGASGLIFVPVGGEPGRIPTFFVVVKPAAAFHLCQNVLPKRYVVDSAAGAVLEVGWPGCLSRPGDFYLWHTTTAS